MILVLSRCGIASSTSGPEKFPVNKIPKKINVMVIAPMITLDLLPREGCPVVSIKASAKFKKETGKIMMPTHCRLSQNSRPSMPE